MKARKKTFTHRILSGTLALLGFSACMDDNDVDPQMYMYGTISVRYISSIVTDANEKPIEGIRSVMEYKGINGEVARDTAYTDASGRTRQEPREGIDDVQNAKVKLTFEDVDGEKNGEYESKTVEVSVMNAYVQGEEVKVKLEEKKNNE